MGNEDWGDLEDEDDFKNKNKKLSLLGNALDKNDDGKDSSAEKKKRQNMFFGGGKDDDLDDDIPDLGSNYLDGNSNEDKFN